MCAATYKLKRSEGFALAEVLVALFFVTVVIALVTGLGQQVANFSKSSRQTSAVIEIRNRVNSFSRNTDDWMNRLRSSADTASLFTDCIPDSAVATSDYDCPAGIDSIFANDPKLSELAGTQLRTIVDTSLVDNSGQKIAGDLANPVYMDSDGGICSVAQPEVNCPLKSTGYFLRSNPNTTENPGSVRFIVKVERNLASSLSAGMGAMKPQYMTVDVGADWMRTAKNCPSGSLKLGYLSNGNPYCVSKAGTCPAGQVAVGVSTTNAPLCVSQMCTSGTLPVFDPNTNGLTCSSASPCPQGTVFLGYYGTSGEKICSNLMDQCAAGTMQVGIEPGSDGTTKAVCKTIPTTCTANQMVALSGDSFTCVDSAAGVGCDPATEVLVGINANGTARCEPKAVVQTPGTTSGTTNNTFINSSTLGPMDCGAGKYLRGLAWDETQQKNTPICESISTTSDTDTNDDGMGFVGVNQLPAFTQSLASNDYDRQKHIWPLTCHVTVGSKTYQCGYFANRFTVGGTAFNVATEDKNYESVGTSSNNLTSRRCIFINGQWKMYSGSNRYNRVCTGGVMYKKMEPPAARLEMRALGHPEFSSEATLSRVFVSPGHAGASPLKAPTATQLMNHFNSCDVSATTTTTDPHCLNLKAALDKAKRYTNLDYGFQNYPGHVPQFCQAYNGDNYYWAGCGSGCGVVLKVDYKAGLSPGTHGYRFFMRWARNYLPAATGSNFPTGSHCTGGSATAGTNRIRVAPPGLAETDGNESTETGAPEEDE